MFVSINWIKEYVDLEGLDIKKLINSFTLATAEVEDIIVKGEDIRDVVVGEILSVENHPNSKKLHLLKVDGGDRIYDVVCGAPNVRENMKIAFVKAGGRVPAGEITKATVAGYESEGMCCSAFELGLSDDKSGLMEIDVDAPNGTSLKDIYPVDDIIFEVDNKSLTNRPDLWGHYGIAREFAALTDRELKPLPLSDLAYDGDETIKVTVGRPDLVYRYSCVKMDNITKNVSPMTMQIRLYYCGMRGINLLADLTNYLMLEMGQPMHAFDSRKVEKLRIKRFDSPFTFTTLDGVERNIDENTLMICNDNTPVAIAGIMGGLDSEIVEDTTRLTLESATFDAVSIRKSTVRLSHRTDASMRYEKCLDPEMTVPAIARFVKLLTDIDSGVEIVSSLTDEEAFKYDDVTLTFDKAFVDRYTGIEIANDTIVKTLESLGFGVKLDSDEFTVNVPSWRRTKDVTIKADIIEEITRIYGYDNFDVHTTETPVYPVRPDIEKTTEDKIKDILVKRFSLHEAHSYVWMYYDECKALGIDIEDNIKLVNATNPNIETIRKSIIPTQLCQVRTNNTYAPDFGIFEVGRVVEGLREDGLCNERKKLAITLFSKTKSMETLYFELRDILATITGDIKHCSLSYEAKEQTHCYEHPKNLNSVILDKKIIGEIGIVHPVVLKKIDKKANIVFAEIDVTDFANAAEQAIVYEEPSKFPGIEIDLSFVCEKYAPIGEAIENAGCALIKGAEVVDLYRDENGKSITVRIYFAHPEKTLTREEVMNVVNGIIDSLSAKGIELKK